MKLIISNLNHKKFAKNISQNQIRKKLTINLKLIFKTITSVFFAFLSLDSSSHVLYLSPNKTGEQKVQLRANVFSDAQSETMRYRRQRSDPIFFLLSHGASAKQGDPFYQEKLGTCFKDKNHFIRTILGEQAANDQNLISTKRGSWHWITDQTASENYAWYLLEDREGLVCWRIFIPAANDVRFIRSNQTNLIRAIIAPKPDFPRKTIYLIEQKKTHWPLKHINAPPQNH